MPGNRFVHSPQQEMSGWQPGIRFVYPPQEEMSVEQPGIELMCLLEWNFANRLV
jgi:hypothetical protein